MERTAKLIDAKIEEMIQLCRDSGMNVTPQRISVYRALLGSTDHPTPEMLYQDVSRSMPSLSLATIYKSLEALQRLGLVREVPVTGDSRRYDANLETHHHLICSSCGAVRDYYSDDLDAAAPRRRKLDGFAAQTYSMNVIGVCKDCQRGPVH